MKNSISRFGPAPMVLLVALANAAASAEERMSGGMMSGWMMPVCAVFGVLVLLVLVLVILALLKHLRGDRDAKRGGHAS